MPSNILEPVYQALIEDVIASRRKLYQQENEELRRRGLLDEPPEPSQPPPPAQPTATVAAPHDQTPQPLAAAPEAPAAQSLGRPRPSITKYRRRAPRPALARVAPAEKRLAPRPTEAGDVSLTHHMAHCTICHHPEREAIEEAFLHWWRPGDIAFHFQLGHRLTVYRHAHAFRLFQRRLARTQHALGYIVEQAQNVKPTADSIIRAVRAMSCLDENGRWTEPAKHVIITHEYRDMRAGKKRASGEPARPATSNPPAVIEQPEPAELPKPAAARDAQAQYLDTPIEKKEDLTPGPSLKPPKFLDTLFRRSARLSRSPREKPGEPPKEAAIA